MMARPRSRKEPIQQASVDEMVADIANIRADGYSQPVALITDIREWREFHKQDGALDHCQFWPGGEETFDGVAVIIRRGVGKPRVIATQRELEAELLP